SFTYVANDGALDSNTATVKIAVNGGPSPTTGGLLVVDPRRDSLSGYSLDGAATGVSSLNREDDNARGVATSADGSVTWVLDEKGEVFVYDAAGALLGSWELERVDKAEGIAISGSDLWVVDREADRVYFFAGGADRLRGHARPTSSFKLARGNRNPMGLTTDGEHLWVVDNGASIDQVFRYSISGELQGQFEIDARNTAPSGVSIDPSDANRLWIVDALAKRVFRYDAGATTTSGQLDASADFALSPDTRNPQGIAASGAAFVGSALTVTATDDSVAHDERSSDDAHDRLGDADDHKLAAIRLSSTDVTIGLGVLTAGAGSDSSHDVDESRLRDTALATLDDLFDDGFDDLWESEDDR
ncbi:MAG: hypothetical protein KDA41_21030, partial [Planctomycetales bacterium]|nr:hypothetical protein [Planctomycetales bacterium]